ncbi:hypothetical protein HPP92_014176 [Vanilla planifolia]|uniref:Maspardin n=1 Tax=Vanilla planifolia TaxID=51239 RepID=A0A835UVZ3_VANPL|nr:hypothetical protein HPP92_014176 [Vanilla planifolia]
MFSTSMPWSPLVGWTPAFLLKRYILTGIRDDPQEPFIADSVDFVVAQIETLSREDLSSRLTLNAAAATVGPLLLSDSVITIMDTNDYCAIPQALKDEVSERYPGARRATMKTGGDFPFLSRPDEVNLYLQLHLRRVGVEAKVNNILGISKDGSTGSMYDDKGNRHGDGGQGSSGSHHGRNGTQPSSSNGRPDDGEGVEPDVSHSESQGSSTSLASCLEPLPSDSETKLEFEFFTLASINTLAFGLIHFLLQDSTLFMIHLNLGKLYFTKTAHLSMANHISDQVIR